jgi:tetratricopeptide (TPR) repeat protein
MKRNSFKSLAILLLGGIILSGCNGLGKMAKNAPEINFNLEPSPLIVRGDSVEVNISGTFPAGYFAKKATIAATPVLVNGDQGYEQTFESVWYQGEKAAGNHTVVSYTEPTNISYTDKIAYDPRSEISNLDLMIVGTQGSKTKEFDPISIGLGVRTTPYLMQNDDMVLLAKDNFVRTTEHEQYAVINYLINRSNVRSTELRDEDIVALSDFVKMASENDRIELTGAMIEAYASPDGELSMNEDLANDRGESAHKVVGNMMKKNKIDHADDFCSVRGMGEDWAGFKSAMQASTIQDKDLILRILEMYSDNTKREQEIKNLATTYKEIANQILPELRRSQIHLGYKKVGYSDEELVALSKSNPDTLNVEEVLYTATLTSDMDEKLRLYMIAERNFPADYRGANNAGYVLMMMGKNEEAKEQFEKALDIKNNPISANNLGTVMRQAGDRSGAKEQFKEGASAGSEVYYNMGLIDVQNGDYASAITNFGSYNTFNVALAKMLNGDNEGATRALKASEDNDTAMGHYLAAIISARSGDEAGVVEHLNKAIAMDAALADKAKADLEFLNYRGKF